MTEGRAQVQFRPPGREVDGGRARRRWWATLMVAFLFSLATAGIWAWPAKASAAPTPEQVPIFAQAPEPCRKVAAFIGVYTDPDCSDDWWLPDPVKKCAGATAAATLVAYATGGALAPAVYGGLAGCIPWALDD